MSYSEFGPLDPVAEAAKEAAEQEDIQRQREESRAALDKDAEIERLKRELEEARVLLNFSRDSDNAIRADEREKVARRCVELAEAISAKRLEDWKNSGNDSQHFGQSEGANEVAESVRLEFLESPNA